MARREGIHCPRKCIFNYWLNIESASNLLEKKAICGNFYSGYWSIEFVDDKQIETIQLSFIIQSKNDFDPIDGKNLFGKVLSLDFIHNPEMTSLPPKICTD